MRNEVVYAAMEKLEYNYSIRDQHNIPRKKITSLDVLDSNYTLFKLVLVGEDRAKVFWMLSVLTSAVLNALNEIDDQKFEQIPKKLKRFVPNYSRLTFISNYGIKTQYYPESCDAFLDLLRDFFNQEEIHNLEDHPKWDEVVDLCDRDLERCKQNPDVKHLILGRDGYL